MTPDEIRAKYQATEADEFPARPIPTRGIQPGDIVRNRAGDGRAYVCVRLEEGRPVLSREIIGDNPPEWLLVGRIRD
jgi:hypothetical protein